MKDYLKNCAKWCEESIKYYNQYFDSRVEKYHVSKIGVVTSFKLLLSQHDVNSTDLMYFGCYYDCVGKLDLIGALINEIGD